MGHDHGADESSRDSPGGGPDEFLGLVSAEEFDIEGFGEVLSEEVGGTALECFAVLHESFDGIGGDGARELFGVGFCALCDGDGEDILGEVGVEVEDLEGFFLGLIGGFVCGVSFLPEEFRGSEEEAGSHFPSHDVGPLVDEDGEVAVGLDPLVVHLSDDGFGGGAYDEWFFEFGGGVGLDAAAGGVFFESGVCDEGAFHGEAFDVFGFFCEEGLGDEEGEVGVDVAGVFEAFIEVALDGFPDGVAFRADDHAAFDWGVVG